MTTASQTMVARVLGRRRENTGLVVMVVGAALLVASLGASALWPPRALQAEPTAGITAQ